MIDRRTMGVGFGVGALTFAALFLWHTSVQTQRAEAVLSCIMLMPEAAPLDVSQAHPGYAFEAAADWCDRFVEGGGRGFGAVVPREEAPKR